MEALRAVIDFDVPGSGVANGDARAAAAGADAACGQVVAVCCRVR